MYTVWRYLDVQYPLHFYSSLDLDLLRLLPMLRTRGVTIHLLTLCLRRVL